MRRSTSRDGQTGRPSCRQALSFALTLLAVWPSNRLTAQELANNSGALFLLFPVGAQAVAMGQTAATLEGRGEAAFWNPAGLATIERGELAFNTASLAAGTTHALTVYFPSHRFGVLGGAVYLVDYGDLERTDSANNAIARIAPRNIEFLASYATALAGSVTLGINYKLIEFVVDCSGDCSNFPNGHGVTHALDVGGQFAVGPGGALRVAVAVRNVGFKLQVNNRDQADALPARLVIGAAYRILLPGAAGIARAERLDLKVAADVDSPWGSYGDSEMRVGIDVGYQRLLRLRGGYAFVRDGLSGPSVGMGVTSGSIGVDLARAFLTRAGALPRRGAIPCSSTTKRWNASPRAASSTAAPARPSSRRPIRRPTTARYGCWRDVPSGPTPLSRPTRCRPNTCTRCSFTSSTPWDRASRARGAVSRSSRTSSARRSAAATTRSVPPRTSSACCSRTMW